MRQMARPSPGWFRAAGVAALLVALAMAGCGSGGQTGADAPGGGVPASRPAPPARNALPPGGCPTIITDPGVAQRAVETARPGDRVCLSGTELASATLRITASGTPGAPVQVLSDGAQLQGIDVRANQVEIAGFTLRDGGGLSLRGGGLTARHNNVLNARQNGIACICSDSVLESNMVDGSDGTGIWVEGERITVRANTVSSSVSREASDADGMRFFGNAIRITENIIRDISAKGYPEDEAPHTDCFQTYDSDAPPTYDVVISNNRCERVDVQCLISTGKYGNPGVPPGARSIVFADNFCDVGGSQAVMVEGYPHVEVRGNTITGPNLYRGIYLSNGSTDSAVIDNVMLVNRPVFEADEESEPVREAGNRVQS